MEWTILTSSTVLAPTTGLLGVLVGAGISSWTTRRTHKERLAADQTLADRRATAEIALADRKLTADIELAQKKFTLDHSLAIWRRRYDLAEQVLTTAYEVRDVLTWARTPLSWTGEREGKQVAEGESRHATEVESERLRRRRNSYFIPIERLANEAKTFSTLQALAYTVGAHFGQEAIMPLAALAEIYRHIKISAGVLIEVSSDEDDRFKDQGLDPLLQEIGRGKQPRPDATDKKIDAAIEQLETICKPVLSEKPPT